MSFTGLDKFVVIDSLRIREPVIEKRKISSDYLVTMPDGSQEVNNLVYTFEEDLFDPESMEDKNLASVILAQVAMNYGLFCKKLIFDGIFDETDRRFIRDMTENTSREIYVNKLLKPNLFLLEDYKGLVPEKRKSYTAAGIEFSVSDPGENAFDWSHWETSRKRHCVLSSGGKDSLLSYGLLKEIGRETHPVFINESGRHWFTALNAYRWSKANEPLTGRVWSNSDRIFNWMLRHLCFIRKDFNSVRSDDYPIRLWTVAVFIFGAIPIMRKKGIGRLIIGDENDTTRRVQHEGITHYDGLYDQSRYFDNYLSRYYMKKGWNIVQFSLLRSLSELLILKILTDRYPHLQEHQISCHAAHETEKRIYPCGKCEKCRRIVGMLTVLNKEPGRCGYDQEMTTRCLDSLASKSVKQIGPDLSHLYYLLVSGNHIPGNAFTERIAREQHFIMKLRFDNERSRLRDIPNDLREPVFRIMIQHADGAIKLSSKQWIEMDLFHDPEFNHPYPFELIPDQAHYTGKTDHLWAELTWPEIEKRLEEVDIAILPCGAIEQHGPHLPVDVDAFDADYLARKVAEACSHPRPFVLPLIPYGVSYHHDDFKGTLSVGNNALSSMVYDIGIGLAKSGIKKLVILNGHGDNNPTLNYAAQMINRDANIFVCVETGETSDEDLYNIIDTRNDIHAGEVETSTSLAIRPHLVKMDRATDSTLNFGSIYLNFSSDRGVPWYVRTKNISESGVMGDPTKASAEKGMKMWEIMIAHLVRFIEELKNSNLEDLYQKRY